VHFSQKKKKNQDYIARGEIFKKITETYFTFYKKSLLQKQVCVYRLSKYPGPDYPILAVLTGWPVRIKERTLGNIMKVTYQYESRHIDMS